MRIAVVSSPRSGNSFVRNILSDALKLENIHSHNYKGMHIPEKCIYQIHWYREPNFQSFLAEHNFSVLTVARHPLDILVSVFNFIRNDPSPAKWLEGNVEIDDRLVGHSPASEVFLDYALSWGAENLFSVTYQWWHDRDAIKIRYEDFATSDYNKFAALLNELGAPKDNLEYAIACNPFERLKHTPNKHGWQGIPGLWKKLVPHLHARKIYKRHKRIFKVLGYSVEPTLLTKKAASRNWEILSAS